MLVAQFRDPTSHHNQLTVEEFVDRFHPEAHVVRAAGLVPDQCAAQVRFRWHWTEAQAGICADDALGQLPFWPFSIERLPENGQQASKESG